MPAHQSILPCSSSTINECNDILYDSLDSFNIESGPNTCSLWIDNDNDTSKASGNGDHNAFDDDHTTNYFNHTTDDVPHQQSEACTEQGDTNLKTINAEICEWAISCNVSKSSVSNLLCRLQKFHPSLPKTCSTLLSVQCVNDILSVAGGSIIYFGILKNLEKKLDSGFLNVKHPSLYPPIISECSNVVTIMLNVDGLPLFKSSAGVLWPILCICNSVNDKSPFVIQLFYGTEKPNNVNEFFHAFITELTDLYNGFCYQGTHYILRIASFICDAPARNFIKQTKAFNGYFGCDFCRQKGKYFDKRIIFPEMQFVKRTDQAFREMNEKEHQHHPSPLHQYLPMVTGVPPEYMHLVCLGVMKKLIHYWVKHTVHNLRCNLSAAQISEISEEMEMFASFFPFEFHRRPRSFWLLERWKASEYRSLLLYLGPIIFRKILPKEYYNHFLLLHFAIIIFLNEEWINLYFDQACACLNLFVFQMEELYGLNSYIYNVHCLLHLADFVKLFGTLDLFSAFPFESFLGKLKRKVKTGRLVLQQLANKIQEEQKIDCVTVLKTLKISSSAPNNHVMLENGDICCVTHINGDKIDGQLLKFKKPLYLQPYSSEYLQIGFYELSSRKCEGQKFIKKVICIPHKHYFLIMPYVSMKSYYYVSDVM